MMMMISDFDVLIDSQLLILYRAYCLPANGLSYARYMP